MKKFKSFILMFIVPLIICLFSIAQAQAVDWHTANQVTVAWDEYNPADDSNKANPGDVHLYNVYIKAIGTTNVVKVGDDIVQTQHVITMANEGFFLAGVSTVRYVDVDLNGTFDPLVDIDEEGNSVKLESEIVWSDDPVHTPTPFGLRYFESPGTTGGLRVN